MNYQGESVEIVDIGWTTPDKCPVTETYVIRTMNSLKVRTSEGKIVDILQKKD